VGVTSTHGPLTTTNSPQELIMADANLNASRVHPERHATVQQLMRWHPPPKWSGQWKTPEFFPLLRIAGKWLIQAGFEPGQRVRITVEHGRLIITHD
jgi:toxic protein SymE